MNAIPGSVEAPARPGLLARLAPLVGRRARAPNTGRKPSLVRSTTRFWASACRPGSDWIA